MGKWLTKSAFPGERRNGGISFSIDGKGYVGLGGNDSNSLLLDFWQYTPVHDTWVRKADFPAEKAFCGAVCSFTIGSKGYVLTYLSYFYAYDPQQDIWIEKARLPGGPRPGATGFSIGNKGYVGTGNYDQVYKDFWEYDPSLDRWTRKADFEGQARTVAQAFSLQGKGYIGFGYPGTGGLNSHFFDLWEYDPLRDSWQKKAEFTERKDYVGFSWATASKAYVVITQSASYPYDKADVWEFDTSQSTWRKLAYFPSGYYLNCQVFTVNNSAYVVGGFGPGSSQQVWQFNP